MLESLLEKNMEPQNHISQKRKSPGTAEIPVSLMLRA
jgi:hypothetical protein